MTGIEKENNLKKLLREMGSVAIAFSGGVDSSYLLKIAYEELNSKALALTATSPTYPEREKKRSAQVADLIGARQIFFESGETDIPEFKFNPPDRCYYCKKELFEQVAEIALAEGIEFLADGSNMDDLQDHRPGLLALKELKVRSPLRECDMTKSEIRERSKALGLPTWDLPAFACLSSRFPYGTPITEDNLKKIDMAESALYDLGFKIVRVRHHGDVARIELGVEEISRMLDRGVRADILERVKAAGYKYVALDLQGYRTGSMNEVL